MKSHIGTIRELSAVMSIDFWKTLNDIHPSLSDSSKGTLQSISNDTLARLTGVIHSLKQQKQQRLQKVTFSDLDEVVQVNLYLCLHVHACLTTAIASNTGESSHLIQQMITVKVVPIVTA